MNYTKPATHPDLILKLIASVAAGREILSEFLTLYRSGRVTLCSYESDLLVRLRAALGEGQPVGACFVNDGQSGQIYYDPSSPLGVLAPFLVHEMAHATDASLWTASNCQRSSKRKRDKLMLEAETRAFELQYRFVQELRAADPKFDQFMVNDQARVRVLHEKLSQQDIAELYGLVS